MRKVLSARGGGIKGLRSATILSQVERIISRPIYESCDLMAGTSTGSLLITGLAAGIPAADMVDFYLQKGPKIFSSRYFHYGLFRAKYDIQNLHKALVSVFGDMTLGSLKVPVFIPSTNVNDKSQFFKSWRNPDLKCADVGCASSAASLYFDPFTIEPTMTFEGGTFVDGGFFANNACSFALTEAKKLFPNEEIKLVDIACPVREFKVSTSKSLWERIFPRSEGSLVNNFGIVNRCLNSGVDAASAQCEEELGDNYLEIEPLLGDICPDLDEVTGKNLEALSRVDQNVIDLATKIAKFLI